MSDVRRMTATRDVCGERIWIEDHDGTHALMPVEEYEKVKHWRQIHNENQTLRAEIERLRKVVDAVNRHKEHVSNLLLAPTEAELELWASASELRELEDSDDQGD